MLAMNKRYYIIDSVRGVAILLMIVFHFCFLLKEFTIAFEDFSTNQFWQYLRLLIVTMFLLLVGVSLRLSTTNGMQIKRYVTRLAKIGLYGTTVSIATYFYDSDRTVYFGILQFIFSASVLGLLFLSLKWVNFYLGLALIILSQLKIQLYLDSTWFYWSGLLAKNPYTLDYVPLIPWFGVVLIGISAGTIFESQSFAERRLNSQSKSWLGCLFIKMGQNSLNIYMAHVPILYVLILVYEELMVVF